MNEWIRARVAQLVAEGMSQEEAQRRAKSEWDSQPQLRARVEGREAFESFGRNSVDVNINLRSDGAQQPQEPQQQAQPQQGSQNSSGASQNEGQAQGQNGAANGDANQNGANGSENGDGEGGAAGATTPNEAQQNGDPQFEQRVNTQVDRRVAAILAQPENPMAAVASGMQIRSTRLDPDQLLGEVLFRTVAKQISRDSEVTAQDRQEVHNILQRNGIDTRALTIEGNGTVIRDELARQFVVKPSPDIIGRNHLRSLPMANTKKTTFPRFDRQGLAFQWNRSSSVGGGSMSNIAESDPTLDTFEIEVTELNGATPVPDSFLQFNASGPMFVQDYLLPELRSAAQYEEDRAIFLSTGTHPDPSTFQGLARVSGATVVAGSANGDAFNLGMLGSLLRAMPVAYRGRPDRLAFYLPVSIADDYLDELEERKTPIGDAALERYANIPGPRPIGVYRSVPIYSAPQLPTDETQGTNSDASTINLVHRDIPALGDALSIRIEPYRLPNFGTRLQLQEFVGLGYQFVEAIVRRGGVRPRSAA